MPANHLPVKWRVQAHFRANSANPIKTDPAEQFLRATVQPQQWWSQDREGACKLWTPHVAVFRSRPKKQMHRPHLPASRDLQATNIEPNAVMILLYSAARFFLCLPKLLTTATVERGNRNGAALFSFFLLAAYIVFHKHFPVGLFRTRLANMTAPIFAA